MNLFGGLVPSCYEWTKVLNTRMFKHKHTMVVKTITITEEAY